MTSFLSEVFSCAPLDCATLTPAKASKPSLLLLPPAGIQTHSSFSLDEEVTVYHNFDETWYHARVTAVRGEEGKATVDVEYMDGEAEVNKEEKDVFAGLLSMDQVLVSLSVRNGCHDSVTNVTLKSSVDFGTQSFNLSGATGKKKKACVGLYISNASLSKHFANFQHMTAMEMSKDDAFVGKLESNDVQKLVMIHFCAKARMSEVIKKCLKVAKSDALGVVMQKLPRTIYAGQTIGFAYCGEKEGIKVVFECDKVGNENSVVFDIVGEARNQLGSVIELLTKFGEGGEGEEESEGKAKLCARLPQLLRL